jgi:Cytochrome P460
MLKIQLLKALTVVVLFNTAAMSALAEVQPAPAPNGITLPKNYKNWQILSISHRTDKNSLRIILANPVAYKAATESVNKPWPDGSMIAKLAWKDSTHPNFAAATVPGELTHVEFMIRDSKKFVDTNGWGYARWLGMEQKPYGNDADFAQECSTCHLQAKDTGYVFTRKAPLP